MIFPRGCHFGQKVDLGGKNTFYSQSVLHHFLSISQFLDFSNLILNSYFEVNFVTCQDGWVVRALDSHARDPWFKSHWQQAFLLRKGFQKFFKKWLSPMWKWWDISSSSIMAISSLVRTRQFETRILKSMKSKLNLALMFIYQKQRKDWIRNRIERYFWIFILHIFVLIYRYLISFLLNTSNVFFSHSNVK